MRDNTTSGPLARAGSTGLFAGTVAPVFGALAVIVVAFNTMALSLIPTEDNRFISQRLMGSPEATVVTASPPFSDFNASLGGGSGQVSSLGAVLIQGNGGTFDDFLGAEQVSRFDLTFRVDERARYTLQGFIDGLDSTAPRVALLGQSGALFDVAPFQFLDFDESGFLEPEVEYQLIVSADTPGLMLDVEISEWSFSLLVELPEPDTAALFAFGLFAMLRCRAYSESGHLSKAPLRTA